MDNSNKFPLSRKLLQQEYASWLADFNWQWFVTLTFRYPPHPEQAKKYFMKWIHWLNRKLYGNRYYRKTKGVFWALALEYHKSGVIHFHALLGDIEDLNVKLSRSEARNKWFQIAGIGRVDPIDDKLNAVTNYVSKYIVKGGEIDLSPALRKFEEQKHLGLQSK
jgi:hypothetical protein